MNKLMEAWRKLENETVRGMAKNLVLFRRDFYVYAIYDKERNQYGFSLSLSGNNGDFVVRNLMSLRDLKVYTEQDTMFEECQMIIVKLLDNNIKDEFMSLCQTIYAELETCHDNISAWTTFTTKLSNWFKLFQKKAAPSLKGLVNFASHLHFIHYMVSRGANVKDVLKSWRAEDKDFVFQDRTVNIEHSFVEDLAITISNPARLDDVEYEKTYIYNPVFKNSAERGDKTNLTVRMLIEKILIKADYDEAVIQMLNWKMIECDFGNYLDNDQLDREIKIEKVRIYDSQDGFPAIIPAIIPKGVVIGRYKSIIRDIPELETELYNELINRL